MRLNFLSLRRSNFTVTFRSKRMSMYYGWAPSNVHTVNTLTTQLLQLQAEGQGGKIVTVRGEYALTEEHTLEDDAVDFYGSA